MKPSNSMRFSILKIRSACRAEPESMDTLARAGVVHGQFGITALRARQIVNQLVAAGELTVSFDSCNIPLYQVNSAAPAGSLLLKLESNK
jgi:hypothetical protein